MLNLLPPEEKGMILRLYRMRLATIALTFLPVVLLLAIIFLAPSYYLVHVRATAVEERLDTITMVADDAETVDSRAILKDLKGKLALIDVLGQRAYPTAALEAMVRNKTAAIRITDISLTRDTDSGTDDRASKMHLKGVADNRDALVLFRDSLAGVAFFDEVNLPIESLARNTNIEFSLTITGDF